MVELIIDGKLVKIENLEVSCPTAKGLEKLIEDLWHPFFYTATRLPDEQLAELAIDNFGGRIVLIDDIQEEPIVN